MTRSVVLIALVVGLAGAKCEKRVVVSNADELERAVGEPRLSGFDIVLKPGVYKIKKTLMMQREQHLIGTNQYVDRDGDGVWDPISETADERDPSTPYATNESIIDGSERQGSEMVVFDGSNSIEGITLRGAGKAAESVNTFTDMRYFVRLREQADLGTARVTNCVLEGGYHAIGFRSSQTGTFNAEATGNVVREMVEGVLIGGESATNAVFNVKLARNRITGKPFEPTSIGDYGVVVNNASSTGCTVNVSTEANIVDSWSSVGIAMAAGFVLIDVAPNDPPRGSASNNTINWTSTNDAVWRNGNGAVYGSGGALNLNAAQDLGARTATPSSNNKLNATLRGTRFTRPGTTFWEQNLANGIGRQDIGAAGLNRPNCGVMSKNNALTLDLQGATTDNTSPDNPCWLGFCGSVFVFGNDRPGDASNTATLIPADVTAANTGFAPAITGDAYLPACEQ